MANKKPIIRDVDYEKQLVALTEYGSQYVRNVRWTNLPKMGKIATLQFCNWRFVGKTPLKWSDAELNDAWARVCSMRSPKKYPTPTPTPKEEPMPTPKPTTKSGLDDALRLIVESVIGDFVPEIDSEQVNKLVIDTMEPYTEKFSDVVQVVANLSTKVDSLRPKVTEIHLPKGEIRKIEGIQHEVFPKVLVNVTEGVPSYLVGPAGTGKSTIAENVSKSLGLDFSSQSVSSQTTVSNLVGYMSANGDYVGTEFRNRYENGGVFLLDEVDNGNPNVLTVLNSALSNSFMSFPDGMIKRNDSFVLIATANTFGNGATAEYVGRNALDKAFLDRFAKVTVGYDEQVEQAMLDSVELDPMLAAKWLNIVRVARSNAEAFGLKVVVSPRATMNGAKLLRHKGTYNIKNVAEATFLNGLKAEQAEKLLTGITLIG